MIDRKPSKAFMNRFLAYALTRITYRDAGLLEDYHSVSGELNMDFYSKMLTEVQSNYEKWFPGIKAIVEGDKPQTEDDAILAEWLYHLLHSMSAWLPPQKVRDKWNGSIADSVLGGEFLTACSQHSKLTDEQMMRLNIDVHNRFYTLVCREALICSRSIGQRSDFFPPASSAL